MSDQNHAPWRYVRRGEALVTADGGVASENTLPTQVGGGSPTRVRNTSVRPGTTRWATRSSVVPSGISAGWIVTRADGPFSVTIRAQSAFHSLAISWRGITQLGSERYALA